MAEIRPFIGIRYDQGQTGALSEVIAPPYDVIDEAQSKRLHDKNPYNVIRLILNPINATDDETNNRYTRSAKLLREWRRDGILVDERDPAIYVYEQTFDWEGLSFTRRGFMARCRLEKFGEGRIYPHEETLSGPKADRLKLFHATGANLSQIFGLYPDDDDKVGAQLEKVTRGVAPLEAKDELGVVHRMWPIASGEFATKIAGLMGSKPVFIADGHHRYETGLKHLEERAAAGKVHGPDDPANFILMMLVGMNDPGLKVMPTHRLLRGLAEVRSEQLQKFLTEHFDVEVVGQGPEAGKSTWEMIESSGRQDVLGICSTADDAWHLLTLRSPKSMDQVVTDHSPVWKSLGVAILHRLVIDHCLKSLGKPDCRYVHLTQEVLDAVKAKECPVAALVQPATVEHIQQLAGTFEKMPAKSTYFYPKLASGLVFNPIQG